MPKFIGVEAVHLHNFKVRRMRNILGGDERPAVGVYIEPEVLIRLPYDMRAVRNGSCLLCPSDAADD